MAFRGTIPDFQLANPIYVGARVTFYTADEDGVRTTTLATLYAAPTGTATVRNPHMLDGDGKFSAPVYIEAPVIAEVVAVSVGTHYTGVIAPRGRWRDAWATAQLYFTGDTLYNSANKNVYVVADDYTSGASVAADVTATHLQIVLDVATITAAAITAAAAATFPMFPTKAVAEAVTIPPIYDFFYLGGWNAIGVGFQLMEIVDDEPDQDGYKFELNDGRWANCVERRITPEMTGAYGDAVQATNGTLTGHDDTTALQYWLSHPRGWKGIDRSYIVTAQLNLSFTTSKHQHIDAAAGAVIYSKTGGAGFTTGVLVGGQEVNAEITELAAMTGNMTRGADEVTLASAPSVFLPGDCFVVWDDSNLGIWDGVTLPTYAGVSSLAGTFGNRVYYWNGQWFPVVEISTATLRFATPAVDNFTTANCRTYRVPRAELRLTGGLRIISHGPVPLYIQGLTYLEFDWSLEGGDEQNVIVGRCYQVVANNADGFHRAVASGTNYGGIFNAELVTIHGGIWDHERHGLATGGAYYIMGTPLGRLLIEDVTCSGHTTVHGTDVHGHCRLVHYKHTRHSNAVSFGGRDMIFEDIEIYGGESYGGAAFVATEPLGGDIQIIRPKIKIEGNPNAAGVAIIDLGGLGNTETIQRTTNLTIRDAKIDAPNHVGYVVSTVARTVPYGVNIDIDGLEHNCTAPAGLVNHVYYAATWLTGTLYHVGDVVGDPSNSQIYVCAIQHTSGTLATDVAAVKWTASDYPPAGYTDRVRIRNIKGHPAGTSFFDNVRAVKPGTTTIELPVINGSRVVASAATTNIGVYAEDEIVISGTVTITSFGSVPYRRKLLRFEGILTLTDNAVIDLPNAGSNIVTAANDTCVAVSNSLGVWRIFNYARAAGVPVGTPVAGVAAGYKIARGGAAALDGSNPTPIATGLATIVAAVVTLRGTAAPGDNTSVLTHDFTGSDGTLNVYAWKNTGGTDPTLVASTGTETFDWIAIGT